MSAGFRLPQAPRIPVLGFLGNEGDGIGGLVTVAGMVLSLAESVRLQLGQSRIPIPALQPGWEQELIRRVEPALRLAVDLPEKAAQQRAQFVREAAAQAWGYLDKPRSTDVGIKPPLALDGQQLAGNYSTNGVTFVGLNHTISYYNGYTGLWESHSYYLTYAYAGIKSAFLWGEGGVPGAPLHCRISFVKFDGSTFMYEGFLGGGFSDPVNPWRVNSTLTFVAQTGTPAPIDGKWGTGVSLQPVPYSKGSLTKVTTLTPQPSAPAPLPAYLPKGDPATVPGIEPAPVPQPEPEETPGKKKAPAIAPPIAPPIERPRVPLTPIKGPAGAEKIGDDSKLRPRPKDPIRVTDPDVHLVDGIEVGTGQPRTDLQAVAKEVGRVENKLAISLPKISDAGEKLADFGDTLELLKQIYDFLTNRTDGGVYKISSTCDLDANKKPIIKEAPYSGGSKIDALDSKVDAIAALLQHHKNLKQPNCTGLTPTGNVTVTFTELI